MAFSLFGSKNWLAATALLLTACMSSSSANASELRLFGDISLNDTAEYVSSLPGSFECSALYDDKPAFCFDQLQVLNVDEGMLSVFLVDQKVRYVEYSTSLTAANYSAVLAGLRRKGLVFAHLSVHGETLDVLAGIQNLDRKTLDDQMFALANRYDFTAPRQYLFLDKGAFNHAYRRGYKNVDHWLTSGATDDMAKEQHMMVKMSVSGEQIILSVAYPFAKND
ncbi:hypothetical protein MD588_06740 [Photobacterium sp. SDRW27]|uniref:hypothetical protein n=1 Tax=Photobacterium obscurum TaxID=2829490 RepID=UPI002243EA24|nr:hypothetical protein [Photobacterium obscurum]MCW8328500.1 hypothetical protein [Photobacterium obscurum]